MSSLAPEPFLTDGLPWWPETALPQALSVIGGQDLHGPASDPDWVDWACQRLALELDRTPVPRPELRASLARLAPGLIWHPDGQRFLLMPRCGRVVGVDGAEVRADLAAIERALTPAHPSLWRQGRRVAGLAGGGEDLALALCQAAMAGESVFGLWRLRRAPVGIWGAARLARLPHLALVVLILALIVQGVEVALWTLLGQASLTEGRPSAWAVAGLMLAPAGLGLLQTLLAETLARRLSVILRKRILRGALCLPEGALRADGPEGLLARGLEAQGFEGALTATILGAPMALAGTLWAIWALSRAAFWLMPVFVGLLVIQPLLIRSFLAAARSWTVTRRGLAARMIGWMIGHRSLPFLGTPDAVLAAEAPSLTRYALEAARMDRRSLLAFAVLPNGWTLLALGLLAATGLGEGDAARAMALGSILLAAKAFVAMATTWASLGSAKIAFDQIEPLWQARPLPAEASYLPCPRPGSPRLGIKSRLWRAGCGLKLALDLSVRPGARLWLTGASGAGKSSLLRVMSGAEPAQSGGLFTSQGPLPPRHVGRVVALVPQFQDNHVFSGSLAFNLLISRAWPPSDADLAAAREVAEALGLGPLIARMPGGLSTHLGETGWQLSQGERSRLFIARALLQGTPVLGLDESLAALDPETEAECMDVLDARADAIVLVRHD